MTVIRVFKILAAPFLFLGMIHGVTAIDGYQQMDFQFSADTKQVLAVDVNNDGSKELLAVTETTLQLYTLQNGKFNFQEEFASLELPGSAIGWDISPGYGDTAENLSIVALIDGQRVLRWDFTEQGLSEPTVLIEGLNGYHTRGMHRLRFSRDVNDDGVDDLIIPGAGELELYIRNPDQSYQPRIRVRTQVRLQTNLNSSRLERRVGQNITIPLMALRDVNGDGRSDLISRTDQQLDVFLASIDSDNQFSPDPSYSIDIAEIEERLGDFDLDRLDFSNLTGILSITHEELLEDVNNDGVDDLILREGGKVSLFAGTATGMNLEQPSQVLRSGGNVLSVFLYDEDGDGLKDLWLWRVETVSVSDVFLWLALSGDVAVEAFIYPNNGQNFARRPTRKITVELAFPSALRLASSAMGIAREAREFAEQPTPPNAIANIDSDTSQQDFLMLLDNQLQVFLNVIEPVTRTDPFLDGLNYSREQDNYRIDVREIIENVAINGGPELAAAQSRSPDLSLDIAADSIEKDIIPVELNGDNLDDLLIFVERTDTHIHGILLLSNAN